MLRSTFQVLAFAVFAITVAFSPLSSKVGGLAWVLLCLAGLAAFFRSKRTAQLDHHRQHPYSLAKSAYQTSSVVEEAARIWLLACLASAIIRIIPHAFWLDHWDRRHAEARLVLGALATVALVKWPQFYRLTRFQVTNLGYALACACLVGLVITASNGRNTPVHAIAWAVSLSFIICILAPMTLDTNFISKHRRLWLLAVLMGTMGVFLSQSRGVFGVFIWLAIGGYVAASNQTSLRLSTLQTRTWWMLTICFAMFIWLLYAQPIWLSSVLQRLVEAWTEVSMSQNNPGEAANTSVGSRLFLWGKALDAIEGRPWFGYGKENSIAMIQQWGLEINSEQVQKLGHLHNEFLDAWVSHGLMGIISLLVLATGMGLMVHKLWKSHPYAAQSILGILFMHLTSGLSNTNMVHNFYGVMLSITISISLLIAASDPNK